MCKPAEGSQRVLTLGEIRAKRERAISRLRDAGHPATPQRVAVIEALLRAGGHTCAEHILEDVKREHADLAMNKTTVYRTLDLFLSLGLATEMRCVDGRAQYELADEQAHYHLVCTRCGARLELEPSVAEAIRSSVWRTHAFAVDLARYPLFGLCPECQG